MNADIGRYGEYDTKGDYHKKLDKKWRYYPVYRAKMNFVEEFLGNTPKKSSILDVGCGEGILVEKFRNMGYNLRGMDLNYSSEYVKKGDITKIPFKNTEFDVILCLDVIEHLDFEDQKKALDEINRILKDNGTLLLAIPNLAHFASRISFALTGKLIRTSTIERHKGDRPINEYLKLLKGTGFNICHRKGIFPTLPFISVLTYMFPDKIYWQHRIYNYFFAYPNWCFLNILRCSKI